MQLISGNYPRSVIKREALSRVNKFVTRHSLLWTSSKIISSLSRSERLQDNTGRSFILAVAASSAQEPQPARPRTCTLAERPAMMSKCSSHTTTRAARLAALVSLLARLEVSNGVPPRKMRRRPSAVIQARRIILRISTSRL